MQLRAAVIRIAGDSKKATYIRRPVQKLFPLELRTNIPNKMQRRIVDQEERQQLSEK